MSLNKKYELCLGNHTKYTKYEYVWIISNDFSRPDGELCAILLFELTRELGSSGSIIFRYHILFRDESGHVIPGPRGCSG